MAEMKLFLILSAPFPPGSLPPGLLQQMKRGLEGSVGFLLEMVGPVLVPGHSFVMIVLLLPFFQSGKSPLALLPGKPFNGPESSSTWSDVVTFIF